MKICRICNTEKPFTEFWKAAKRTNGKRDSVDGYKWACIVCLQKYQSEWRLKHIDHIKKYSKETYNKYKLKHRNKHLMKKFGITNEQYEEMLKAQDGKCAICKTTETGQYQYFSIDHNHKTNKIRELLCMSCNTILGHVKENKESLLQAIAYLEKHEKSS